MERDEIIIMRASDLLQEGNRQVRIINLSGDLAGKVSGSFMTQTDYEVIVEATIDALRLVGKETYTIYLQQRGQR